MTSTMMLIGRSVGNVTRQKVWNSFAPSIAADSFSDGSTASPDQRNRAGQRSGASARTTG